MDESDELITSDELFTEDVMPYDQDGPDLFATEIAGAAPAGAVEKAKNTPAAPIAQPAATLALYRRYRPDTFAEIIGQDHVTIPLQRALVNNKVNHAYLFSGPRGCGKTTSARILARALNCEAGPGPVPCGQCQSCRDLARGGPGSIDVIEIDAASHGGVDEARDLRERAFFAPVRSRYKIYIIDEAHMVSPQGFNALLKVVEEPPEHVKFIFATTVPDKVLGTIRSRTHHYPFRLVPPRTLEDYLAKVCESEGVQVEPAALPLVVRAGAGSVRDSLSVLDQLLGSATETGVSYHQAAALLGFTPDSLLDEIVDAFAAGDAAGVFGTIDKVIEIGQAPHRFAEDLLARLRNLIIVAAVPDALTTGLISVAGDQAERLTTQASSLGVGELTRAAEVIAVGLTEMRGTTAPRLHLELMCSRVLLPAADLDGRGIHARLDRLERRLSIGVPASTDEATIAIQRLPEAAPASNPTAVGQQPAPEPEPIVEPAQAPKPQQRQELVANPDPPNKLESPERIVPPAAPVGDVDTAGLRALWPKILEEVKAKRRFTWILLSQNAQIIDITDGVLKLGLANPGAKDSFSRGGSVDVLKDAIANVIGASLQIEAVATGEAETVQPSRDDLTVEDTVSIEELLVTQLGAQPITDESGQ